MMGVALRRKRTVLILIVVIIATIGLFYVLGSVYPGGQQYYPYYSPSSSDPSFEDYGYFPLGGDSQDFDDGSSIFTPQEDLRTADPSFGDDSQDFDDGSSIFTPQEDLRSVDPESGSFP
jgi:hypothetical protein